MNNWCPSIAATCLIALFLGGCETGVSSYSDEHADEYTNEVESILIAHRLCADHEDCRKKSIVALSTAVRIGVWGEHASEGFDADRMIHLNLNEAMQFRPKISRRLQWITDKNQEFESKPGCVRVRYGASSVGDMYCVTKR